MEKIIGVEIMLTLVALCPSMARRRDDRPRRRTASSGFTFACGLLGAHVVWAANPAAIEIQCADLSREEQAAVEARSRAELIARGVDAGLLSLRCSGSQIEASFTPPVGAASTLSEPGAAARADALVTLVGELLERRLPEPASSEPSGSVSPLPSEAPSPSRNTPRVTPERKPPPEVLQDPDPTADDGRDDSRELDEKPPAQSALLVGGALDTWSSEIEGAAGVLVGVTVPFGERFSVRGAASYSWGLNTAKGVSVRHLLVEGALEGKLTDWSLVSLGGGLSSMSFNAGDKEAGGATSSLAPVGVLAIRLVPRNVSPRFTLGPAARLFGKAREATIDGEPVLHVPRWSVALEAEGRFDL